MTPSNLQELRDMAPGPARVKAAAEYIAARKEAITEALAIRNADIRAFADEHGPAEAARMAGVSLTTIKVIRGGA